MQYANTFVNSKLYMGDVSNIKGCVKRYSSVNEFVSANSFTHEASSFYVNAVNSIYFANNSYTILEVPDYCCNYVVACDGETCYCLGYEMDTACVYNLAEGCEDSKLRKATADPKLAKYLLSLM